MSLPRSEIKIIETITNKNGTAIKFSDGTMICQNTYKLFNITFLKQLSGQTSFYYSEKENTTGLISLPDFPVEFIDIPKMHFDISQNITLNGYCFVDRCAGCKQTEKSAGKIRPLTTCTISNPFAEETGYCFEISYTAIGKWK